MTRVWSMVLTVLLWVLVVVLVVVGLLGVVLPALPGPPLLFTGLLLAAWAERFEYVGAGTLTVLAVLAAVTYVTDFVASAFGAKRFGASSRAAVGAALGGLVGLFFGLPGVVLGPFAGAIVGELTTRRSLGQAGRAGLGATVGLALGAAAKLALAFTMIGVFVVQRLL